MTTPTEITVDGLEPNEGVTLIGKATRQPDGTWRCYAFVFGNLCIVEVRVTFGAVD